MVSHQYEKIPDKRLNEVLSEYVLYRFWRFWDIFNVLLNVVYVAAITIPTLLISVFNEASYARYSLNDPYDLVQLDEVARDPGTLYLKILYQGWTWNTVLTAIIILFWIVSFIDLIIYYQNLTFPMDDTFRNVELLNKNCLQRFGRILEWILLLCALSFYLGYVGLLGVWWLLAAIISPSSFLPYASGAITFMTFVKSKYSQFQKIIKKGRATILGYIEKFMGNMMQTVMKKISEKLEGTSSFVADKAKDLVKGEAFTKMTETLSNAGIVDPREIEKFVGQVETLDANNITSAATAIAANPK